MIEKYMIRASFMGAEFCCLFFAVAALMFTGSLPSYILLLAEVYVCVCCLYWANVRWTQTGRQGILKDMWLS